MKKKKILLKRTYEAGILYFAEKELFLSQNVKSIFKGKSSSRDTFRDGKQATKKKYGKQKYCKKNILGCPHKV